MVDREGKDLPPSLPHEEELTFRYSREERLSMAPPRDGSRIDSRPFWRNTSLMILLLDVVVIVIMALIYHVFLAPRDWEVTASGYVWRLEAVSYQGQVLGSVKVRRDDERVVPVQVLGYGGFQKEELSSSGEPLFSGIAGEGEGPWVFTFSLPLPESDSQSPMIYVLLQVGQETFLLSREPRRID
ncbi:hypothetical protein Spith_1413 [Spirochaeta thermophila DSM 6578]|uniref:Uncharacterized protein n=1 Tax=Winmispira thermophila (strain ATCC 700085 / DSM 6578 / Z-1203) TaxID=869211 RepID=G0G9Y9_WINT7|nr:hypothetical protein [Spirochaeta thermophila]AEJ61677.1 hypothetical protein Spith_1413 [Spirochaeta thermophila DSM 6578]